MEPFWPKPRGSESPPSAADALGVQIDCDLPFSLVEELWRIADADKLGTTNAEFANTLGAVGAKCNFGIASGVHATPAQIEQFYRNLNLPDLALAQACALGREPAWAIFLEKYKVPLTRFAIHLTKSVSQGQDLADSLYSELFGLSERDSQRRSPLASYSGRGALLVWLRAALAQRHVAEYRRTRREIPLDNEEFVAPTPLETPSDGTLSRLHSALQQVLSALPPEDRLLLSFYFLDQSTLAQIGRLMGVHEATVSRKLKRLTANLHHQLLKSLQDTGLSARAAQETLGTDPRDIEINLRSLLQTTARSAFPRRGSLSRSQQL